MKLGKERADLRPLALYTRPKGGFRSSASSAEHGRQCINTVATPRRATICWALHGRELWAVWPSPLGAWCLSDC